MANRGPGVVNEARQIGTKNPNAPDNQEQASRLANQAIAYGREKALIVSDSDKELWEIICDVPRLGGVWPYICCILNVVLPGSGTMLAACMADATSWSKVQLTIGILQFMLTVYIVGWIWSIAWGVLILKKGIQDRQEVQDFLNRT